MMSRRFMVGLGVFVAVVGIVLLIRAVWPRPSDDEQIRRVLQRVADALAAGRVRPIRDALDDFYSDSTGLNKGMILEQLNRLTPFHPEVYQIQYDQIDIALISDESARADIRGQLLIQTRKERTTLRRLTGKMQVYFAKKQGRWRIIQAEGWQQIAREAGMALD